MCGILCALGVSEDDFNDTKELAIRSVKFLRHRGPDWGGNITSQTYKKYYDEDGTIIGTKLTSNLLFHERLSIVGISNSHSDGSQPISQDGCFVSANGEIYNHKNLMKKYIHSNKEVSLDGVSDCEVIAHLFNKFNNHKHYTLHDIPSMLDGQFAFVAVKNNEDKILIARDPLGVAPLYYGYDDRKNLWVSSELKAINKLVTLPKEFPPGHCLTSTREEDMFRYYNPRWWNGVLVENMCSERSECKLKIKELLTKAVKKRLMSDVPFGLLLSGGLDSSLIASIAVKEMKGKKIKTFSIGLKDSTDLIAAQKVADFLGTDHYSITYSIDDGFYALRDVIYHLETYDITTIRAGTPMFLLSRVIKAMGIKMVLSGEGADECFGGYLYFYKAPSDKEFHEETCRKLDQLHFYDVLRANKSPMAWGVETRVPFLDKELLDFVMTIHPSIKRPVKGKQIEKDILRSSFDLLDENGKEYLPNDILWRQKEQFSDGVGYSWVDTLKQNCELKISDDDFNNKQMYYKHNTPITKEGCYYRMIFNEYFPWNCELLVPPEKTIACSSSVAAEWDEKWKGLSEASGRIVNDIHVNSNISKL
tara:strand:- start:4524 stop:6293 length:1770 start_codon:yes stop_codon:yes gene_type:complete